MAKTLTTNWQTIASYNWKPGTGFNFTVYLEARYTTQDKTGNYSKLLTRLRSVVNAGSGSGYGYGWNCSYCNSISGSGAWYFGTETILSSSEQVIYHNADGKKTLTLSASGYVNGAGFSFNISDSVILPTIQRVPTITLANDFNDEDNPIIEFTNPAGFTINGSLAFSYTDQEDMFINGVTISRTNITSPYTFSLTDTERTKLRSTLNDRKEYTVKYTLQAFNGSTFVGEVSVRKKFTFINAAPTFASSLVETDANVISLLGTSASKLIKNASKIKTTITPSAKKSASIKSVEIKHGTYGVTLNASPYVDTILAISNAFEIIVTDSRGYVVSSTITKDLIDYSSIEISQYSFKRVNPTSSNIILNATVKYTQQTFNSTANKPTLKWKLGENGTLNTISSSNYSINTANKEITISNLTLSNVLPYTQQGRLYLVVNDLLTSDSEYYVVSVGIPVYDYGEFDFQVNGDLYIADRNRNNPVNVLDKIKSLVVDNLDGNATDKAPSQRAILELLDKLTPVVLFDGDENGTITLSDSVNNYEYIEIFFRQNQYTAIYNSVKIYHPWDVQADLTAIQAANGGSGIASAYVVINDTTIRKADYNIYWTNGGNTHTDAIYITRVLGYK